MSNESAEVVTDLSNECYWLNESVKNQTFEELFEVQNEIACGPFGTVLKCHPHGNPSYPVCTKVLQKNKDKRVNQREVSLLLKLKHPNICRFMEVIESPDEIYLINEYLGGGQVLERVSKKIKYNERIASRILKQILEGLKYIHQEGLVHGDLKPENFMFEQAENEESLVKITDIALNPILDKDLLKNSLSLSTQYCAPEMLRNDVGNPSSDMWSIGAFAYTLLCGEEPFKTKTTEELYTKILKAEYDTESSNYKKLSVNAKDFIIRLLVDDPKKRMTVGQALNNQWLQGKAASLKSLPLENMQALVNQKKKESVVVEGGEKEE